MANLLPTLVDWARSTDPDGAVATVAEMLAQCNEILKDMIWQEGNLPLGHKTSCRVGLPQGDGDFRGVDVGPLRAASTPDQGRGV